MPRIIKLSSIFALFILSILFINYILFYFNISDVNNINFFSKSISSHLRVYFTPLLYAVSLAIMFMIEFIILGWSNSSLKSILSLSKSTCRVDVFYIWIKLSGISNVLFNLIFFGFGFYFLKEIESISIFKINNIFFQFIFAILLISFIEYVYHRILHSNYFWELHKIHHAAEEMNIFTASREHPFVVSISILLISVPVGIFGVNPFIAILCKIIMGGYNLMIHSKVYILPNVFKNFLITTKDHHIHHSTMPDHFNKNFGNLFNIWDKIFGTYYDSENIKNIKIGINDKNYNNNNSLKQIYMSIYLWFKNFKNLKNSNNISN